MQQETKHHAHSVRKALHLAAAQDEDSVWVQGTASELQLEFIKNNGIILNTPKPCKWTETASVTATPNSWMSWCYNLLWVNYVAYLSVSTIILKHVWRQCATVSCGSFMQLGVGAMVTTKKVSVSFLHYTRVTKKALGLVHTYIFLKGKLLGYRLKKMPVHTVCSFKSSAKWNCTLSGDVKWTPNKEIF